MTDAAGIIEAFIHERVDACGTPLAIGLCGAQGSGKTTAAAAVVARLKASGLHAVSLSIDDLYLARADRLKLAQSVHPLLATRGVPGTHDVALGRAILTNFRAGKPLTLPRFDKAQDDRMPEANWTHDNHPADILILEGWCVAAVPQEARDLAEPVNALERSADADGRWRGYVNDQLAGDYQTLFGALDALILLAAPGFEIVERWRMQQEQELAARQPEGTALMSAAQISRFIQHYERLTRHILSEMPARADLTIHLADDRHVTRTARRPKETP